MKKLSCKKVLITSGGTLEKWDRVRGHTNLSKGTMGCYLAESALANGAEVIYLHGYFATLPTNAKSMRTIMFEGIEDLGEKIKSISKNHQVICISHLPQIAALADAHFLISKEVFKEKTCVLVKKLDYNERIDELSRLLGGVNLTNTTKLHAKEMLDMSKSLN
ncbi:MAG: hypothetical protein LOD89_04055 [Tissierellales bacterium]